MDMDLHAGKNDLTMADIAANTDVFYIGGTKVGALFGEAVVITNPELKKDFRYSIKQRGGMLAKGRLLGIQFLTLFEENRYFDISAHAARLAEKLKDELTKMGVKFYIDSPTNQQFPILPDAVLAELKKNIVLLIRSVWMRHTVLVRFLYLLGNERGKRRYASCRYS